MFHHRCQFYRIREQIIKRNFRENVVDRRRKMGRNKPRFMALRALGRSRVMTARPLGKTAPFTKSSPEAIVERLRRRRGAAAEVVARRRESEDADAARRRERLSWTRMSSPVSGSTPIPTPFTILFLYIIMRILLRM